MSERITRRTFLGTTAPAIGAGLLTARTLRAQAPVGPSQKLGVGLIGCGGRGRYLAGIFRRIPEIEIVAVCDVHKGHAADARGDFDGKPAVYHDYRQVLADKNVDAVIVATTGQWHVLPTIDACAAGKDVYVEKPLGTSIGEGRAAVTAAKKHNRVVQIGTQQHSWPHYAEAVQIIRSGELGDISNVHVWDLENFAPGFGSPPDGAPPAELDWDFFVGPSPGVPYNPNRYVRHYWFFDYGGGWQLDWAVHHYDIIHWAMGVQSPIAATGAGGKFAFPKDNTQWPDTFSGTCEYPPGPVAKAGFLMTYTFRGGCNHPIEKRPHGKAFYGTNGVLAIDRSGWEIWSQERDRKKVIEERSGRSLAENDAVLVHAKGFLECIRTRKTPQASVEVGHYASNPGHLMNIAWRVGRRIKWDADKEHVIDDPDADKWVAKAYRMPWSLPTA